MTSRMIFSQFACVVFVFSFQVNGDDWPQWRGPTLNSVSEEANLPDACSRDRGMLWRTALPGPAGSSPVVWGDQVFVTSVEGRQNGAKMSLLCFGDELSLSHRRLIEASLQSYDHF